MLLVFKGEHLYLCSVRIHAKPIPIPHYMLITSSAMFTQTHQQLEQTKMPGLLTDWHIMG